jgi:F-type H+-transporting ATPase subunit b
MQIIDILQLLVPNVWTAISQLCASALLFFLMYKLAWKPIKKILDQRSEYEQSRLKEADDLRQENEKLNEQAKSAIIEANKTAETIVKNAREEGISIRDELVEQGKQQSKQMMDNAQRDIELQRSKMMEEMHEEIVDAALLATEKMLNSKLNSKSEKADIDSFVKEVINK